MNKQNIAVCNLCSHRCSLKEGQTGLCGARTCSNGKIVCDNYGEITSIALDPIEKKPLNRFMPGTNILSVGSYGCNLICPFCQNSEISCARKNSDGKVIFKGTKGIINLPAKKMTPEEIANLAVLLKSRGNIGLAYTYNEPMVGMEFVRDTARLIHKAGMKNVLVTNGSFTDYALDQILPFMDAMNIDLKSFRPETYSKILGGDLELVKNFIRKSAAVCHVEITTLVVPGLNDNEKEISDMVDFIASLNGGRGEEIPYHISRFFPQWKMRDKIPTDLEFLYNMKKLAEEKLKYVYIGNV
ncbi:MAG: AmmeMemoRadiSam system radical SAM enzyme [Christensenellales bacterium]|jgi:pyruvate formate lyase activating enzyme